MQPLDQPTPTETPDPVPEPTPVENSTQPADTSSVNELSREPSTEGFQPQPTPVAPVPPAGQTPSPALPPTAPKNNKKKLIIGVIIVAVLALLGGGAAAFASWYQNPDKVVTDSILNSAKAEHAIVGGTATIDTKDAAISADIDLKGQQENGTIDAVLKLKLKTGELAGKEVSVNANSVVVKEGDVYFKISNVEKALDTLINAAIDNQVASYKKMGYTLTNEQIAQIRAQAKSQFSGVVGKIDNQWIKVSADDLKDDKDDKTSCMLDAFNKIGTDNKLTREVADTYQKNRFIVVKEKLGTKDGSLGYLLSIDKDAAKKFGDGVKDTELGKALVKCDSDVFKSSDSKKSEDTLKDVRFELWVDQWSHKVTRIVTSGTSSTTPDDSFKADFKFDYNTKVDEAKAPENAKSIKEIEADIKAVTGVAAQTLATEA